MSSFLQELCEIKDEYKNIFKRKKNLEKENISMEYKFY